MLRARLTYVCAAAALALPASAEAASFRLPDLAGQSTSRIILSSEAVGPADTPLQTHTKSRSALLENRYGISLVTTMRLVREEPPGIGLGTLRRTTRLLSEPRSGEANAVLVPAAPTSLTFGIAIEREETEFGADPSGTGLSEAHTAPRDSKPPLYSWLVSASLGHQSNHIGISYYREETADAFTGFLSAPAALAQDSLGTITEQGLRLYGQAGLAPGWTLSPDLTLAKRIPDEGDETWLFDANARLYRSFDVPEWGTFSFGPDVSFSTFSNDFAGLGQFDTGDTGSTRHFLNAGLSAGFATRASDDLSLKGAIGAGFLQSTSTTASGKTETSDGFGVGFSVQGEYLPIAGLTVKIGGLLFTQEDNQEFAVFGHFHLPFVLESVWESDAAKRVLP